MALPKAVEDRIIADADEYARTYSGTKMIKRPYIAGATAEAERSQKLVAALENLAQDVRRKPNDTRYATALKKADEALTEYNTPSK